MEKTNKKYTEKDTNEYYNTFSDVYELLWDEQIHTGYFDKKERPLAEAVVQMDKYIAELANLNKNSLLLNVGSGRGGTDRFFAKNFGVKIEGIDLSEKQIKFAVERADQEGLSSLCHYTHASATAIPFPDKTFDYIFIQEAFFHIHDKIKAISEFNRVLKKDGLIVIEDTVLLKKSEKEPTLAIFGERVFINDLLSPEEHTDLFKKGGFVLKNSVDVSNHLELTYHKIVDHIQNNKEKITPKIPDIYKARLDKNFGFDVSEQMTKDGVLGCVIFVFQKIKE